MNVIGLEAARRAKRAREEEGLFRWVLFNFVDRSGLDPDDVWVISRALLDRAITQEGGEEGAAALIGNLVEEDIGQQSPLGVIVLESLSPVLGDYRLNDRARFEIS